LEIETAFQSMTAYSCRLAQNNLSGACSGKLSIRNQARELIPPCRAQT